jgi:DNA-binding response OmpR family regulator
MPASILIVEDSAVLAMDIKAEAASLGMSVTATRDPEAAIRIARQTPPTAALVDVNLNGGYEGLDVARVLEEETAAWVAIITAYTRADLADHMDGLALVPILFKPVDIATIGSLLRSFATSIRGRSRN